METRILDILRDRKATRAIAERPVESEKVEAILEAAKETGGVTMQSIPK